MRHPTSNTRLQDKIAEAIHQLAIMTSKNQYSNYTGFALAVSVFIAGCALATSQAPPTCQSMGDNWYFPNACATSCSELGRTMDLDRTRNVDGKLKCFCVDQPQPFCTDTPRCEDLGIYPGTAKDDCASVCGEAAGDVTASTTIDDNGYQFHYVVSCTCGDGTYKCGNDFVLFSDLDYMMSCSGGGSNSLQIANGDECDSFCLKTQVFQGGNFAIAGKNKTCSCLHSDIESLDKSKIINQALACDDATARENDGSGLGEPCYEEVGVNQVKCPYSVAPASPNSKTSATKTLVSSTVIMGIWMLPW